MLRLVHVIVYVRMDKYNVSLPVSGARRRVVRRGPCPPAPASSTTSALPPLT